MEKLVKVIKINLLSLIALPLLLLACVCKMVAKALEKLTVIVSALFFSGVVLLIFNALKNPEGILSTVVAIIIILVVGALFVALVMFLIRVAGTILFAIYNVIVGLFNGLYEVAYTAFLRLFETCQEDYQFVNLNGKKGLNACLCLIYSLLRAVEWLIATLMSLSLFLAIGLSVLLVGVSLFDWNRACRDLFGLSLWQYMGRLDLMNIIFGSIMYLVLVGSAVLILLSLGVEWNEWGRELRMDASDYARSITDLKKNDLNMTGAPDTDEDTGSIYMQNLSAHMQGLDELGQEVEELLEKKDNALLRNSFGNYFRALSSIVDECSSYKSGIPYDKFQKLIPRIQQLEKQRAEVKEMIGKLKKLHENPYKASVFFSGCNSVEKLDKRYKSLCKAYHPDSEGGDEATFKVMQEEYQRLKNSMSVQE